GEYARAWRQLADIYTVVIFRYCYEMFGGDAALAEDLTQQVLMAAGEGLPKFRAQSSVKRWVLGIAHNMVRQEIGTRQRRRDIMSRHRDISEAIHRGHTGPPLAEALADSGFPSFDTHLFAQQQQAKLREAIATLEPRARSIVLLRFGIGTREAELSVAEIAEILGLSRSDVYRRLNTALIQLKKALDDEPA
ncbi:RNA polymerase sigma factor, partial [Candidatus Entotheonella palauensis]